jgi:hypothetical protein
VPGGTQTIHQHWRWKQRRRTQDRLEVFVLSCHDKDRVKIILIIEGESMSQVTGTYTLTVTASSTLAINPSTGSESLTEGVVLPPTVLATVSGGTPPYTYQISGLPSGSGLSLQEVPSADGVTGDADVQLSGTPNAADAAASPITLTIVVTDSAGGTVQLKRKL